MIGGLRRILNCAGHAGPRSNYSVDSLSEAKELLGFGHKTSTDISPQDLRHAYYTFAKECHPDSAESAKKDATRFNRLAEAYALLSGKQKQYSSANTDYKPKGITSHDLWARLFFGDTAQAVIMDQATLRDIHAAAELVQGGVDRGGMWALVRGMHEAATAQGGEPHGPVVAYLSSSEASSAANSPTAVNRRDRRSKKAGKSVP